MKRARADESRSTKASLDGRQRRAERSRDAIVAAIFDLVSEGDLRPSAYRVAEKAGVGIRSVFRHFSEMDTLFAAMNDRLLAAVQPLFDQEPPKGNAKTRAAALIRRRATLFERIAPYMRSGDLNRRRSRFLQEQHGRSVQMLRDDLVAWLPEAARAPTPLFEALDVALCFETWNRLRTDQGLSRNRAVEVVERMVEPLVSQLESRSRLRPKA